MNTKPFFTPLLSSICIVLGGFSLLTSVVAHAQTTTPSRATSSVQTGTSSGTSSDSQSSSTEEEGAQEERGEDVRGTLFEISTTTLSLTIDNETSTSTRRIAIGNVGSVEVTRDGEAASFDDLEIGDGALVKYDTGVRYEGTVISTASSTLTIEQEAQGERAKRTLTFPIGGDIQVTFEVQPGVNATAPLKPTILNTVQVGQEVEVRVQGESITNIEANANGNVPSETGSSGFVVPLLLTLIALVAGMYFVRKMRTKELVADTRK